MKRKFSSQSSSTPSKRTKNEIHEEDRVEYAKNDPSNIEEAAKWGRPNVSLNPKKDDIGPPFSGFLSLSR